jgi:hypothetical protein
VSDPVRPDSRAFAELRLLVRGLQEELGAFRRRALQAEARVRELETAGAGPPQLVADPALTAQMKDVLSENAELKRRLVEATERTNQMLGRLHFLRQQEEQPIK